MEKEPQSTMSSLDPLEAATPDSPATVSTAPLHFSPVPFSGARGPENGSLLLSSPFSPSPAPHFEPSPVKQSPMSEASSPINCSRDPHRVSPVPRRKQVGNAFFIVLHILQFCKAMQFIYEIRLLKFFKPQTISKERPQDCIHNFRYTRDGSNINEIFFLSNDGIQSLLRVTKSHSMIKKKHFPTSACKLQSVHQ